MLCYCCDHRSTSRFCWSCQLALKPKFQLLPMLPNISLGGYFYDYNNAVQTLIHHVKFRGNYRLADYVARHIFLPDIPALFFETDAFVCVPSHWWRNIWRGRAPIPRLFHYVLENNKDLSSYLKRVRYSRPSSQLSRHERLELPSRFHYSGPPIHSVTIIDDICTTGSTLIDLAQHFKLLGVSTIQVLVFAYRSLDSLD